ncbi:general substrate transporter [Hymenopellis radicata]|nr:general substrate transporter [Hymenopellis radicata]
MCTETAWTSHFDSYDSAFIGTSISLASFKEEFDLVNKSTSELNLISANIVSMYQAGCFFGAIFRYPIGYFWGRKIGLIIAGFVFCVGAMLQTVASDKTGLGIIYGGRVIVGLAIGAASNLAPIYVAEISPPAIRGRLIGMYELCWQIGGVTGFWINYGVTQHIGPSHKQWLIAFAVQLVPGGMLAIGSFFITESPRFLVTRDRLEDALKNLSFLRHLPADAPYVVREFCEIEHAVAHERSLVGAGFFGPMKTSNSQLGRRWLLMLGSIGGALSMFYIGAYIAVADPTSNTSGNIDAGGRSAVAAFYVWTIFYSPTWNGTPWVVGAEIFPQHVRTFTQACMAASNWLYTFLIARFTPQMFEKMDYGVYFFFASLMVFSIAFVFCLLPETKTIPLERMDELFATDVRPWNAHRIVMERIKDNMHVAETGMSTPDFKSEDVNFEHK